MDELVGTLLLAAGFVLGQVTTNLGIQIKHNEDSKRAGRGVNYMSQFLIQEKTIHDSAIEMADRKISSNPTMYRDYTDPVLYQMLVEECKEQLGFSHLTFQINTLKERAYEQSFI